MAGGGGWKKILPVCSDAAMTLYAMLKSGEIREDRGDVPN